MNSERIDTLRTLLQADPGDSFARYALGLEYLPVDPQLACATWRELLLLQPDHVPALFQLGQALAGSGDLDAARDFLQQGIAAARAQGDAHALGEMEDFLDQL